MADGIHSKLRDVVVQFNLGVVQMIPTGTGAQILPAVVHEGTSIALGVDVASLL